DLVTKAALERDVRLVRFEDGKLEIALEPNARKTLAHELSRKLQEWTNRRWMVVVSTEAGAPSVRAQKDVQQSELEQGVRADPLGQAVLARCPGAEIVGVRKREEIAMPAPPPDDPDDPGAEPPDDSSAFGEHRDPDDMIDDL